MIKLLSLIENLLGIKSKIDEVTGYKYDKKGNLIVNVKSKGKDSPVNITFNINIGSSVIPYMNKLSKLIEEKYQKENFHYIRNDLIPFIAESRLGNSPYEYILSVIKPHLIKSRPADFGALRAAATICKLEDEGTSELELNNIRGRLSLCQKCKWSNTLYNWLRCGEVFEQEIFPYMNFCLTVTDKSEDFEKLFFPFWDQRLAFHPTKIFISIMMTADDLWFNLEIRLIENKEKEVKVYSRASRNKLAEGVIDNFLRKQNKQFISDVRSYSLGNTPAKTYIITPNKTEI